MSEAQKQTIEPNTVRPKKASKLQESLAEVIGKKPEGELNLAVSDQSEKSQDPFNQVDSSTELLENTTKPLDVKEAIRVEAEAELPEPVKPAKLKKLKNLQKLKNNHCDKLRISRQ